MIVKPSVSFLKTSSDVALVFTTNGILKGMTNNPNFPTPSPSLPVLATALDAFSTARARAADGGKTLTSFKNERRAALAVLLRELAAYLVVACKGNLTALLSSRFPHQKPNRQPVGTLPVPANLTARPGLHTGELDATVAPVPGASLYSWRVSAAKSPEVFVIATQTTAASNTFSSLTPGEVYKIQVNAVGTAGPSDWSNPAYQRVL